MDIIDSFEITLPNGKYYENNLDEHCHEWEFLDGAALKNGCFCKYYCRKRDWHGESYDCNAKDSNGLPAEQHYCSKHNSFGGFAYFCMSSASCFEEGKSAGVKKLLNRIRRERIAKGFEPTWEKEKEKPNETTLAAMQDSSLIAGPFATVEELFEDLNSDKDVTQMTIGALAKCLDNYDVITIFENEKMVYDGLVKDLNNFLNEQILKIDIIDYKQLHVKI